MVHWVWHVGLVGVGVEMFGVVQYLWFGIQLGRFLLGVWGDLKVWVSPGTASNLICLFNLLLLKHLQGQAGVFSTQRI